MILEVQLIPRKSCAHGKDNVGRVNILKRASRPQRKKCNIGETHTWAQNFAEGMKNLFCPWHMSKMFLGEVMFLASVAWVKGEGVLDWPKLFIPDCEEDQDLLQLKEWPWAKLCFVESRLEEDCCWHQSSKKVFFGICQFCRFLASNLLWKCTQSFMCSTYSSAWAEATGRRFKWFLLLLYYVKFFF